MTTKIGTNWKTFTAAHRIPWHEKCSRMHGHTWKVRVEVEGEIDVAKGILVDFGEVGRAISEIIDPWDHKFLAARDAKRVANAMLVEFTEEHVPVSTQAAQFGESYVIDGKYVLPEKDVVVLHVDVVSSENLASYILGQLCLKSWAAQKKITVQVCESGDNVAEASFDLRYTAATTTNWQQPQIDYYWWWWQYPPSAALPNPLPVVWQYPQTWGY